MNIKFLTLYNLLLTSALTALGLYQAHSSQDMIYALSFAPITLFFGLTIFRSPRLTTDIPLPLPSRPKKTTSTPTDKLTSTPKIDTVDIDKRAFLKLIGATGFSLFLYSIFNRRTPDTFFTNAQQGATPFIDVAGNRVDLPEKQPTDGYSISEVDDDIVAFYGFINKTGAWFIMREDTNTGSIRYTKGDSDFSKNWLNRLQLQYDYHNNVF